MPRYNALPPNLPPRLIKCEAAAQYMGVSVGTFNKMIASGIAPKPVKIIGHECKLWDRQQLDKHIDALQGDGELNDWDSPDDTLEAALHQ